MTTTYREFLKEQLQDKEFSDLWREGDPSAKVAQLVVTLRTRLGLTQTEFAEKASVKRPYLAKIESGHANPTVKSLGKLLAAYRYALVLAARPFELDESSPVNIILDGQQIESRLSIKDVALSTTYSDSESRLFSTST